MLRRCSRIGSAIIAGRVACVNRSQSGHWLYWLHGCPRNIIAKRPQQRSTHRDAWIVTTRTSVTKRIERWESQYSRKPWISLWRTKDLQNWQRRMGIEFRDRRAQKQQEALIEMHWYWGCMTCRDSWADWASFDEIDCPIYIQSIRPHRLSASNTHFTIIVKKYHCTDLQHHSPHDSQHSHHLKKRHMWSPQSADRTVATEYIDVSTDIDNHWCVLLGTATQCSIVGWGLFCLSSSNWSNE